MSSQDTPSWYTPGRVQSTVLTARSNGVDASDIAAVIGDRELDDVPYSRVESIVEQVPNEQRDPTEGPPLSQPPSTDANPRDIEGRRLGIGDFEHLSNREAARVLGAVLESFDGDTIRIGPQHEAETDLIWNRQHRSIGFRIVPLLESSVGSSHVDALLDGQTVPADRRSPPELAIVTNRSFTDDAIEYAAESDVQCIDGGQLAAWLRRTLLPMDAVGTVLEDGEDHDGPISKLVELPAVPEPRANVNLLEIDSVFDVETYAEEAEVEITTRRDDPLTDTNNKAGQTGTLYADPEEDGDYDAFDDYLEDI